MIRYRCPHCAALIAAHERRVGQSSVCKACVKPHPFPTDRALWLNERGEPLHAPAAPAPVPTVRAEPEPERPQIPAPPREPEPVAPALAALNFSAASVPELQLPDPSAVEPVRTVPPAPTAAADFARPALAAPPQPRGAVLVALDERADDSTPQPAPGVVTITPPSAPASELPAGRSRPLAPRGPGRSAPAPVPPRPAPDSSPEPERVEPVQLQ